MPENTWSQVGNLGDACGRQVPPDVYVMQVTMGFRTCCFQH